MARRGILRERERWLSAVLIVTAIVGVSAAVRLWPISLPPSVPRPLASRALHAIDAPVLPIPGRVLLETAEPVLSTLSPDRLEIPPTVRAEPATPVPDVVVESGDPADPFPPVIPLLASRRLETPLALPALNHRDGEAVAAARDESHAILELPAVAVTRVVIVAGRGIWTGVRATTAVFRAAF